MQISKFFYILDPDANDVLNIDYIANSDVDDLKVCSTML